ncbi:MAG: hypothetical protein BalsKO_22940 [Balneolaceae bacterium]
MLISTNIYAQSASELFESGKYRSAAAAYETMAASNPDFYEEVAKSYTALKEWDKAIEMYEKYRDEHSGANKARVNAIISLLKEKDQEIYIDNVGPNINSSLDEFLPRISSDGNRMYFYSTDRANGFGGGDVWYSNKTSDGGWSKPNNMGSVINTDSHEGILSLSSDGNTAIVFGNYEGRFGGGDFFYSAKVGDKWTVPCNLGGGVNTGEWESMANLSPDGKTLIFVAYEGRKNEEDADYETDIYISHLRNGAWTTPTTISTVINTSASETWPFLNADGRTLYFSSDGHPGLGGSDLFVTRRIGEGWDNWTTPVNLGKNINSVLDDEDLAIPASGTVAYFTRETTGEGDGFGDDDIFRMILPPSLRPDPVVTIFGNVTNQEDSLIAATLYWSDFDTGEQLGYSTSNLRTGDYLINLPFGRRYLITANQKGYLFQTEMLDLKTMVEDSIAFSEKLGSELFRMQNSLKRIDESKNEYELLLASNSIDLDNEFDRLSELSKEMNQAQSDLNDAIRRARISYLEDNSGYKEVRKDISLTEANEGARIVLENIYFDTGSANLSPESEQELDRLFEIMSTSTLVIEIGGYTDNVGSDDTNMDLSQARAESVVAYVVEKGISSTRISAKGYGENDPRATNETPEGRQENRRVEIKVLSSGNQEGTGGLLAQEMEIDETPIVENLYELYRQAAIAGGIPDGAACYDNSNYTEIPDVVYTGTNNNNNRTRNSATSSMNSADNAFTGSSLSFITHSGKGAHGFSEVSGAGVAFFNGNDKGERNFWGYFLGGAIGGGIEWNKYKDISGLTKLPLSFDYGLSAYLVFNKDEIDNPGTNTTTTTFRSGLGVPIMARLRYNLVVSDIKISPYASYNYNLFSLLDIEPNTEVDGSGNTTIGMGEAPSWLELGARARFKFITGGLALQNSSAGTGIMLRAGLAF